MAGNAKVSKRCKKSTWPLVALTRGDSQILEIPLIRSNTLIHNPWDAPRAVANNSDPQWSSDNEWGTLGQVFCAVDELVSQEFSVAENLLLGPNGESGCLCPVRGSWFFYNSFIVAGRILSILTWATDVYLFVVSWWDFESANFQWPKPWLVFLITNKIGILWLLYYKI